MVASTYDRALAGVLFHEGGYSNDTGDTGGPTKYGITIADVRQYLNPKATAGNVAVLTVEQAKDIYRKHYADPIRYDELPAGVDYVVFDYGINSGIGRSVKALQKLVGSSPDGIIGSNTIAAVKMADAPKLINDMCDQRLAFLKRLKIWGRFGKGWGRRVEDVRKDALAMVGTAPSAFPIITPVIPVLDKPRTAWPLQTECTSFYGDPRKSGWLQDNTTHVACPWPLHMDGGVVVHDILIHKKCADSLARVLAGVWEGAGRDVNKIHDLRYDIYDGSYNLRVMRGGSSLSMHSYACAIDWDAKDNQQHSQHHLFTDQSLLITKFKEENWIWGGDWSPGSIDAMHVQAARIHN